MCNGLQHPQSSVAELRQTSFRGSDNIEIFRFREETNHQAPPTSSWSHCPLKSWCFATFRKHSLPHRGVTELTTHVRTLLLRNNTDDGQIKSPHLELECNNLNKSADMPVKSVVRASSHCPASTRQAYRGDSPHLHSCTGSLSSNFPDILAQNRSPLNAGTGSLQMLARDR